MKIVAEIGASHNGSLERALKTVFAAAGAGATALKIQTWSPDTMDCGGRVLDSGPWKEHSLRDLYRKAHTPWSWHKPIAAAAKAWGMDWHSTPFDLPSLAFLEDLDCPRYKVASFELVDIPLIKAIAQTRKPIILSTGMATKREIDDAVAACFNCDITLLRCVSAYPANPSEFNLASLVDMRHEWDCQVGLSDHTRSTAVPVAAAMLGATMIERHITLGGDGLDDAFASTPAEFRTMAEAVREALEVLGGVRYGPTPSEAPSLALRRSLWVVEDIPAGGTLTAQNLKTARPGEGVEPRFLDSMLGKTVKPYLPAGTPMRWEYLEA